MNKDKFMEEALLQAKIAQHANEGPFGAVIVKDGEILISTRNTTEETNDPTAHAEVNAIRETCKKLQTTDLSGCILYTSCHPCPMCLSAAKWASISKVIYCLTNEDTKALGFDDWKHYNEMRLQPAERELPFEQLLQQKGVAMLINKKNSVNE